MRYKHTQIGYLIICVTIVLALFFAFIKTLAGFNPHIFTIMALILLFLLSFSTLNVAIDKTHLRIRFGWGIFRKSFLLSEIASTKAVKNHWYFGWGIRLWLWPRPTWIFNVSGFDAVELTMKNGKIFRIGTDEPRKLEKALGKKIS